MTLECLFVYGSLMRGRSNHAQLAGARFECEACTAVGYRLVSNGPYPVLVGGGAGVVYGELHAVGATLLEQLDVFEGVPHWYLRERIVLADGRNAWAYVMRAEKVAGLPEIPGGRW